MSSTRSAQVSATRRRTVIDALRRGAVPESGLDLLATGLGRFEAALDAELDAVAAGGAVFKAVRGEYGSGKTFFSRWLGERARRRNFAVAEIQISETETPLHKLETVYRRLTEERPGPRLLLLGGRNWRVTFIDWARKRVFVEPAERGGVAKWTSGGITGLSYALTRAMRQVLLGVDRRAVNGLKFGAVLPERLAVATVAARLADFEGARAALSEPVRLHLAPPH